MVNATRLFDLRTWPLFAIAVSAAMLAGAHAFEHIGKMAPCMLCLRQREIFWAALIVGVGGVVLLKAWPSTRGRVALIALLGLIFTTSAVVAGFHAGVEWKLWPGPAGCSGGALALDALTAPIDLGGRMATVSCSDAPWHLLGLSMAGWNALISAGLAVSAALSLRRRPTAPPPTEHLAV